MPEPPFRTPLRFRLTLAFMVTWGTSGNGTTKIVSSCACSIAKVLRKRHDEYCSLWGAVNPGRSDTQFASAHCPTSREKEDPVCVETFCAPMDAVSTRRRLSESPN